MSKSKIQSADHVTWRYVKTPKKPVRDMEQGDLLLSDVFYDTELEEFVSEPGEYTVRVNQDMHPVRER